MKGKFSNLKEKQFTSSHKNSYATKAFYFVLSLPFLCRRCVVSYKIFVVLVLKGKVEVINRKGNRLQPHPVWVIRSSPQCIKSKGFFTIVFSSVQLNCWWYYDCGFVPALRWRKEQNYLKSWNTKCTLSRRVLTFESLVENLHCILMRKGLVA